MQRGGVYQIFARINQKLKFNHAFLGAFTGSRMGQAPATQLNKMR